MFRIEAEKDIRRACILNSEKKRTQLKEQLEQQIANNAVNRSVEQAELKQFFASNGGPDFTDEEQRYQEAATKKLNLLTKVDHCLVMQAKENEKFESRKNEMEQAQRADKMLLEIQAQQDQAKADFIKKNQKVCKDAWEAQQ